MIELKKKAEHQPVFLVNQFNDKEKALGDARWAFHHAQKPVTRFFWAFVIETLNKQ